MSLQRYTPYGDVEIPFMDTDERGEWVRLDDVVKLLEAQCNCRMVMRNGYMGKLICPAHTHIALIKGEK